MKWMLAIAFALFVFIGTTTIVDEPDPTVVYEPCESCPRPATQ